jgi:uncharacterized protein
MRAVGATRLRSLALTVAVGAVAATGCKTNGSANLPAGGGGAAGTSAPIGGSTGNAGGGGGDEDGAIAFSKPEMLGAFGNCASSLARDFRSKVVALDGAVTAFVATPDDVSRDAARSAFRGAMESWQVLDMLQYGPTGAASMVAGGQDFRGNIYAWPTFGRCAIEEELTAKTYESPNFGTALLVNRRGLGAIEFLLFYEGQDTACTTGASIAAWNALTPDERAIRKRAYAAAAVKDVLARAIALDEAWDPAQMNFVQTMRSAESGNAVYPSAQAAIESVGLALFYIDRVVKDRKMTMPINDNCTTVACCTTAACFESQFAGLSKVNIAANLDGLRRVMEGCEGSDYAGLGFDDLLVSMNAAPLADTLRTQAIAAQSALQAITQPMIEQALVQDPARLAALREAIGELTITIKTSLYTTLNFEPTIIPTDNDS